MRAWLRSFIRCVAVLVITASIVIIGRAPTAAAATPCTSATDSCRGLLNLSSGFQVPYYRSFPLSDGAAAATHAVIAYHGIGQNADVQFGAIVAAAKNAGRTTTTMLIAPQLQVEADGPEPDEAYWRAPNDWSAGGSAVRPAGLSSFAVTDLILRLLADPARYPKLRSVTVVGHSAGGQYAQRYALGGDAPGGSLQLSFVVTNPSSYAYPDNRRPDLTDSTGTKFTVPSTSCSGYNNWRYGLGAISSHDYLDRYTASQLRQRYVGRQVTYLIGSADTGTADLDQGCSANLQGQHRYDRGLRMAQYMRTLFGVHRTVVVPGVGHSSRSMYLSTQARPVLFPTN